MEPYKSLVIVNKVLEGLINVEALKEWQYHPFYSGGVDPYGFCGYIIYGKRLQNTMKITFYGINKNGNAPIHIFISVDNKNKVRDMQFNVDDAVRFIVDKVNKFMAEVKHG